VIKQSHSYAGREKPKSICKKGEKRNRRKSKRTRASAEGRLSFQRKQSVFLQSSSKRRAHEVSTGKHPNIYAKGSTRPDTGKKQPFISEKERRGKGLNISCVKTKHSHKRSLKRKGGLLHGKGEKRVGEKKCAPT